MGVHLHHSDDRGAPMALLGLGLVRDNIHNTKRLLDGLEMELLEIYNKGRKDDETRKLLLDVQRMASELEDFEEELNNVI